VICKANFTFRQSEKEVFGSPSEFIRRIGGRVRQPTRSTLLRAGFKRKIEIKL